MKKFIVFAIIVSFLASLAGLSFLLMRYFYPKQYAKDESGEYVKISAVSNNDLISKHEAKDISNTEEKQLQKKINKKNGYIAKSFNGTIVILNADGKTVYEFTKITINLLPETLQEEILKGYILEDDEALYNFLETYSS